ncbi:MAG: hypothetical protein FWD17_16960, partial [Polyangiaceae bacterium]|nr:hypothetical protein [Polyangiaceae bacterium]
NMFTDTNGSGTNGASNGPNGDQSSTDNAASFGSNDGAAKFQPLPDGNIAPPIDDSGASFGADGAVVGTCVVDRNGCDPTCDELQENSEHEYVDPMPDEGTPLTQTVAQLSSMFASASTTGGPCIVDPPDGSVFPNNWLRPRIFFQPPKGANIFQIRIHADRQMNDLIVYTPSRSWEMPKDIWQAIAHSTWSEDITVTVSAASASGGAATSSSVKFQVAPANANGSMVYWSAVGDLNGLSWLEGFGVGDEGVTQVLTTKQVQSRMNRDVGGNLVTTDPTPPGGMVAAGSSLCIGCHVVAPDQQSVAFLDFYPWPGVTAQIDPMNTGALPTWATQAGLEAFSQPWLGMLSFSPGAWAGNDAGDGPHRVVSTYATPAGHLPWSTSASGTGISPRLAWFDLSAPGAPAFELADGGVAGAVDNGTYNANLVDAGEGVSFGFIATTGDKRGAEAPSWSHDSQTIVYTSTDMGKDGRLAGQVGQPQTGSADLYTVPYNGGAGGAATPLQGAAETDWDEFYPSFSPDDQFVAFDRVPNAEGIRYYAPKAEVFLVPAAGGMATRLAANDPPACMIQQGTGMPAVSPGVTNSWARWSPEYPTCPDGKTYYWLIFSSSRLGIPFLVDQNDPNKANWQNGGPTYNGEPTSQLYLTSVIIDGGQVTTTPAIYIWNQPIQSTQGAKGASTSGSPQSNHTPSWEVVEIPPVPPTPPPPPPPPPR